MKTTLFALAAVGILASAMSPPTEALGECAVHTLDDPPRQLPGSGDPSNAETTEASACVSATLDEASAEGAEGIAAVMANIDERRALITKTFFSAYSTDCTPTYFDTPNARVAVMWDYTDAWDAPLDKGGWGSILILRPDAVPFTSELQGHTYVVDYHHDAYGFGLIMHDSGLGEITFNKEHFRDATGYVDTFCAKPRDPACGGHSHGTSTDEDVRMIVRVVILCERLPGA